MKNGNLPRSGLLEPAGQPDCGNVGGTAAVYSCGAVGFPEREKDSMKHMILLIFCFWAVSSSAQDIPKNAHKNTYGTGWECDRGYYKSGNECLQVQIPENAQLNYYGHGWECKRGFYKSGKKCLPVQIPKNAQLNYYGHGWECKRGFYKFGSKCVAVQIPENAQLNYYGHGWECKRGFYKSGNK